MERYKNRSGNSGVVAYEIGDDSIAVEFHSSFIARIVRNGYAQRLRQ